MKLVLRLAVSTALVMMTIASTPHSAMAVCASGGTVSNLNDCIAEKAKAAECALEWSISPVPPTDVKTGQPMTKIVCMDNTACDGDLTPGQCTFNVGACVNVNDTRIPGCAPTDADTYLLKKPSAKDAARPDKNRFASDNRFYANGNLDGLIPTGTTNACSDERPFVVPLKKGIKKATFQIQAQVTSAALVTDKDTIKFTCLPNPNIATQAIASAKEILLPADLIGGPMAMGRLNDYLIENDRVRFIIRDTGRDFGFMLTYGGHIIDADFQRSGPGRDNFLGLTPMINISSTDNPTSITVTNDGSLGGPAVIQTSGPDDLFDPIDPAVAIKGFATALSIPPLAIDNNIPTTIVNEYTLSPGDDFLEIETFVNNTGGSTLNLYMGEYVSGGGQLEIVAPGLGFGESALRIGGDLAAPGRQDTLDYIGWFGFGEAQGISYAIIPQLYDLTSAFTQSGVVVPVYGQALVGVLLSPDGGKPPGVLSVPAGGTSSFKRWFALADNGMGGVLDARHKLVARGDLVDPKVAKTGFVYGTVTVGGVPVDGARVAIAQIPGVRGANYSLTNVFETKNGGTFQGSMPKGEYVAIAKVPGHLYEGGASVPIEKAFKVGGGTAAVNFDIPATGYVRVDVTGLGAVPISAKVSVVGLQAAPNVAINENATLASVSGSLLGYDAHEKVVIYGLPQVQFAGPNGSTPVFAVPPGTYQFVVSHGPEYSVSKTTLPVTAGSPSAPQVITASVVPVVDSTGFVSADHHVHLINSQDSVVSKNERIVTMLAEGVDYFVASDHDFKTDLSADVAALGASSLVTAAISNEITYFSSGHFGAYPMDLVPGSITGGAVDWGRSGVAPGLGYPSDGSYDLSVEEMVLEAKAPPHNATVVQANHFNSGTLGYFRINGIDTTVTPPQSSTLPSKLRQNPAITNLFTDELTALELWIESNREQNALALGENLGDYFNLMNAFDSVNPTLWKSIVCNSDTHSTTIVQAGGPRNMLASATDAPGSVVPADLADAVNDGRNVCTNGPFVRVSVEGDAGATASHALSDSLIVPGTLGSATVHVDIQSPTWAEYDRIDVYMNNATNCVFRCIDGPNEGAVCTVNSQCPSGRCGVNFVGGAKKECTPTAPISVNPVKSIVPVNGDSRIESSTDIPLTITQDSWVLVVVRGLDGVSKPLFPMNPQSILPRSCSGNPCRACTSNAGCAAAFAGTCTVSNQTVAELSDSNLGQCGVTSMAIANPLFVDFSGDGLYKGVAIP